MANLVLKRFQCVEDTSEIGGESPYFITWVGDIVDGTSTLKLTRKTYWDNNVHKGPGAWPVDDVVSTGLSLKPANTLALAMMVEKDEGIDVLASEIDSIRNTMSTVLRNHAEIFTASDPNFISTMRNTLTSKVRQALESSAGADDDLMEEDDWRAARRIQLSGKAEELPIVTFKGGGGQYNVRYAQT
jgi:hypothetical protein